MYHLFCEHEAGSFNNLKEMEHYMGENHKANRDLPGCTYRVEVSYRVIRTHPVGYKSFNNYEGLLEAYEDYDLKDGYSIRYVDDKFVEEMKKAREE